MKNLGFASFTPFTQKINSPENIAKYFANVQQNTGINLLQDNSNPFMDNYLGIKPQENVSVVSEGTSKKSITDWLKESKTALPSTTTQESPNVKISNTQKASAKEIINYFIGKGYTKEQASGIVGNLHAESGLVTLRPQTSGGPGFGLAQWEHPRQANFKRVIGKDIKNSTTEDQLNFLNWELDNPEKSAKAALKKTSTPEEAAKVFANKFERMKTYNKEREIYARNFYNS